MLNQKQHEGKKTLRAGERSNTNSSQWGQEFALLRTKRTTQTHELVTCRINRRNSRIAGKVV